MHAYAQELPETTTTERTHCLCGSNGHWNTIDPSCPLSRLYEPRDSDSLGFRGSGRGKNMCAIAAAMKENGIKAFEDSRDSAKKRQKAKSKVELLTRLRQFQVSL